MNKKLCQAWSVKQAQSTLLRVRETRVSSRHRSSAFATPRLAVGLSQSALHSLASRHSPVYGTLCSAAVSYRTTLWLNTSDFTLIHRYVCGIESKRLTPVLLRFQWMWPSEANLVTLRLLNSTRAVDAGLFRQQVRAKQKTHLHKIWIFQRDRWVLLSDWIQWCLLNDT